MKDIFENRKKSFMIASPIDNEKYLRTKKCTEEGVRAGVKAAAIACVASAVPTLLAVRTIPWAKANINYTGQALIISGVARWAKPPATIATYFITVDKTILKCAKKNADYKRMA